MHLRTRKQNRTGAGFFRRPLLLLCLCAALPTILPACAQKQPAPHPPVLAGSASPTAYTVTPAGKTPDAATPGGATPDRGSQNGETPNGTDSAGSVTPGTSGYASYTGSAASGDLVYTAWDGAVLRDWTFLDGLSRNFFSDVDANSDPTGSWYCGETRRDPVTGTVTFVWDRAQDVLDAMQRYGVIYRKNTDQKVLYLTFDCGYENGYTGAILDILKEKNVPAAFFLNGHFIDSAPELVRRMLDEGHIVGNHGNNHKVMSKLSVDDFLYEVESNNALLQRYIPGAPYMRYYRPPYGSCAPWDMALIQAMHLTQVQYSWTYHDYEPDKQPDPASALALAQRGLHDGSVLMLHTVGETNTKMLGAFIDYARAEGYTFRSLDD